MAEPDLSKDEEKQPSSEYTSSSESIGFPMDDRVLHASTSLLMMSETPEERMIRHKSFCYGLNCKLVFAVTAAAIGSAFQHGYNIGVVNTSEHVIEEWLRNVKKNRNLDQELSEREVTWLYALFVSVFCVGGMLGGSIIGQVTERVGRRNGLLYNNIITAIASLCEGLAKYADSYEVLIIGRFMIGLNSGINAGLVPVYLTEISPVALRGVVGTVYPFTYSVSILIAQIVGLKSLLGNESSWPYLFLITLLPSALQTIMLAFCPESPKHELKLTRNELKAKQVLSWLRGSMDVHAELEELKGEVESERDEPTVTLKELLMDKRLRGTLFVQSMLMIAQQLSGINIIMYYSTKIFHRAQFSEVTAQHATIVVGCMNVLASTLSLTLMERSYRKTLLLVGFAGVILSTLLLTFCLANVEMVFVTYLSGAIVLLFVLSFYIGPSLTPCFIGSELEISHKVTSVVMCINWAANSVVGLSFLPLQALIDYYVFIIFAVLQGTFLLFTLRNLPEITKSTNET